MNHHAQQPTGMRNWIHRHPLVGVCGAIVVLLISGTVLAMALTPAKRGVRGAYYYDLSTATLFVSPVSQLTPIIPPAADGTTPDTGEAAGVRAYVYSCGSCDVEAERSIGWLEMYNPDVLQRAREGHGASQDSEGPSGFTIMMLEENPVGILVAKPPASAADKVQWMPIRSSAGNELLSAARRCDDGSAATRCEP
jgi:hypothetical protein